MFARFAELEHFTSLPDKPIQAGNCDVVIQRPTIFMKLDAGKYKGVNFRQSWRGRRVSWAAGGKGFRLKY